MSKFYRVANIHVTLPPQILLIRRHRQFIAPVILRMPAVAGDASVRDLVFGDERVELLPEIHVLDFAPAVFFTPPPAIALPTGHPFAQAFAYVLAIEKELDDRGALERFETAHHGKQLHSVVGRERFAARGFQFLARRRMTQDKRPAAGSRVAAAPAIGKELDARHVVSGCFFRHASCSFPASYL